MPRIAIIGYGVVGQAVGAVLAAKVKGAKVSAFDPQQQSRRARRVRIAPSFQAAVGAADYVFLCVPSHLEGKGVDGKGWKRLAAQIVRHARPDAIIVIKSTMVPGDVVRLEELTSRKVVVCPEFMAEGTAERETVGAGLFLADAPRSGGVRRLERGASGDQGGPFDPSVHGDEATSGVELPDRGMAAQIKEPRAGAKLLPARAQGIDQRNPE
jgi:hypothetical protein